MTAVCTKIKYFKDDVPKGTKLKRKANVAVSTDMAECLETELDEYLIDEVSEIVGVPVESLEYELYG